jgi:hypothetical protein
MLLNVTVSMLIVFGVVFITCVGLISEEEGDKPLTPSSTGAVCCNLLLGVLGLLLRGILDV